MYFLPTSKIQFDYETPPNKSRNHAVSFLVFKFSNIQREESVTIVIGFKVFGRVSINQRLSGWLFLWLAHHHRQLLAKSKKLTTGALQRLAEGKPLPIIFSERLIHKIPYDTITVVCLAVTTKSRFASGAYRFSTIILYPPAF